MSKIMRPWTPDDIARLLHMRDVQHLPWSVIDAALRRSKGGSQLKHRSIRKGPILREIRSGPDACSRTVPSAVALELRDARNAAANRMTPTAAFFGDPPPGYSALDRREAAK